MKRELPWCAKCGVVRVKEHRRRFCSPQCAGNHGTTFTPEQIAARKARTVMLKARFVEALKDKGTLAAAARAVGISETAAYLWRKDDREFAEKVKAAIEVSLDFVEAGLFERAVNGVPRGIYYRGERVGEDREYDTRAAEFLLKGRRPAVFGDKVGIMHSGYDGGPLTPSLTAVQLVIHDASALIEAQQALPAPAAKVALPTVQPPVEAPPNVVDLPGVALPLADGPYPVRLGFTPGLLTKARHS